MATLLNCIAAVAIGGFSDLAVLINSAKNSSCLSREEIDCSFCPAALYSVWYLLVYAAAVLLSPLSVFDQGETRLDGVCSLSVSDCDRRGSLCYTDQHGCGSWGWGWNCSNRMEFQPQTWHRVIKIKICAAFSTSPSLVIYSVKYATVILSLTEKLLEKNLTSSSSPRRKVTVFCSLHLFPHT